MIDAKALFSIGYGLYVVTAKTDKENGCIANAVMQVTSEPITLAVALNKSNFTTAQILETGEMSISVLSESAPFSVFERFGFQSGRDVDKLEGFDVWHTENGLPALTGEFANTVLSLKVTETKDMGSHMLFLCAVSEAVSMMPTPTMSYAYYHANVKPKPTQKGWVCKICGYKYDGENLPSDFICPLCKHPAADFEKIN